MIDLKKLKLKNIGRFITEQEVIFDELGNLVQVDGENRNTGGSSGSGKSTFFNALDYLLGLNDLPVTVLQSRLTKEGILVTGQFEWDGREVELIRGKGKLSISVDGNIVEGSAKLVEEKIDEMLGMSRELFRPMLHKRQKEGGFFLAMTPSKTHEFLTNVLDLSAYTKKLDNLDKQLKDLISNKQAAESVRSTSTASLLATHDAILALGLAPIRDMHPSVVSVLKDKADLSLAVLTQVETAHKEQNQILDQKRPKHEAPPTVPQPVLSDKQFDRTALLYAIEQKGIAVKSIAQATEKEISRQNNVSSAIQERKISLSTFSYKVSLAATAKTEATKLAGEIKKIRECLCPTCEQTWASEASKAKENEMLSKLASYKIQIQDGSQAAIDATTADKEISILMGQLAPTEDLNVTELKSLVERYALSQEQENTKMLSHISEQSEMNSIIMDKYSVEQKIAMAVYNKKTEAANSEFALAQQGLRHTQALEIDQARGQADVDNRVYESAANKLKSFTEADTRYQNSYSTLSKLEEQYKQNLDNTSQSLVDTEGQIVIAEEVKRAIKSFMSCSFDEALEEIGDSATRIIRSIPNMANSTIQFQGIRETQSGKIKEEVNAVVSMDGEEGIDIRSLSGGEKSSADLAIDLAVIDLIESRSNKGINVFILDEPFTGLDTVSVEMVLEVLKNVKINKKIIIVDHNELVKSMVTDRIIAVRDGLTSSILQ